jgi:putative hydrolase of the HAD superfamily
VNVSEIKCIAFDVVGTLLFADPPVHMAYHRIGKQFGSRLDPVTIRQKFRESMSRRSAGLGPSADILGDSALQGVPVDGHITSESAEADFWRSVINEVLPDVEDQEGCFRALFEHFAQPGAWSCYMDVEETLPVLVARGYRLALASNFDSRLHAVCEGHPSIQGISRRVISSEIGHRKPSPRFFERLAQECGCEPSQILMVGDDAEHDVQAAREIGMQALHLDRSGGLGPPAISTLDELLDRL